MKWISTGKFHQVNLAGELDWMIPERFYLFRNGMSHGRFISPIPKDILSAINLFTGFYLVRPCPHDTFPNWARSIAPSSRPVARVHTGATGTLVPDPRDHLSTWNEWARSIAIGCALSNLSCGRSSGCYRPVSKSAAVGTRLLDLLLPLLGTRALSRVFNRLRHVKADTRTLISKVLQSSKPYSHTNKINK